MAKAHLPFTIYHLPLISHFSFTNLAAPVKGKLLVGNSLKIDNCKLSIGFGGGVYG